MHKIITRIQAHFIHDFKEIIPAWKGNTAIFSPFREKLEKILSCSIEGTKLYCEYCEKLIEGKFIRKSILLDDFHFCSELCREHLEKLVEKYISHTHIEY